ncbi:MAG: hypothetical protein E3J72_08435 [Planctomycetota bacterium]|nr:MAG: hypothetical protein E3J72_08435 [Planctomycetota bacterium]
MRTAAFSLLLILILALPVVPDDFEAGSDTTLAWVPFDPNYQTLIEKRKPGILYFYSSNSLELCKYFETELFAGKGVKTQAKKYICIKVNGDAKPDLLKKFGVAKGEAAIVFLSIYGKVDDTLKEKIDLKDFVKGLRKAYDLAKKDGRTAKTIEKNMKIAGKYEKRKLIAKAAQIWDELVKRFGEVPHPLIAEAKKKYDDLTEEGMARLKPALSEGKSTANQNRNATRRGASNISTLRQAASRVGQAVSRIKKILNEYPIPSITEAARTVLADLAGIYQSIMSEIARLEAEEANKK